MTLGDTSTSQRCRQPTPEGHVRQPLHGGFPVLGLHDVEVDNRQPGADVSRSCHW